VPSARLHLLRPRYLSCPHWPLGWLGIGDCSAKRPLQLASPSMEPMRSIQLGPAPRIFKNIVSTAKWIYGAIIERQVVYTRGGKFPTVNGRCGSSILQHPTRLNNEVIHCFASSRSMSSGTSRVPSVSPRNSKPGCALSLQGWTRWRTQLDATMMPSNLLWSMS
jgi:hypothetical protein